MIERALFLKGLLVATGGCNAHRGAIWALGLLVAGAAQCRSAWIAAHLGATIVVSRPPV